MLRGQASSRPIRRQWSTSRQSHSSSSVTTWYLQTLLRKLTKVKVKAKETRKATRIAIKPPIGPTYLTSSSRKSFTDPALSTAVNLMSCIRKATFLRRSTSYPALLQLTMPTSQRAPLKAWQSPPIKAAESSLSWPFGIFNRSQTPSGAIVSL